MKFLSNFSILNFFYLKIDYLILLYPYKNSTKWQKVNIVF